MDSPRKGRASIFRGKRIRVNGQLTPEGATAFEQARQRLRSLYREITGHQPSSVSEGDAIEFLARGEHGTRMYLEALTDGQNSSE